MNATTRRQADERGAIAVIVALVMVALLGCVAISIDLADMEAKKQQLQTGADAAAMAIAQDCGSGSCGNFAATAQAYGQANLHNGRASTSVTTPNLRTSTGSVTVVNTTTAQHLFAPVLGVTSSDLAATSTAEWGRPRAGRSRLPMAVSYCELDAATRNGTPTGTTSKVIYPANSSLFDILGGGCTGLTGAAIQSGFHWLPTDNGCNAITSISALTIQVTFGASVPSICSASYLATLRNRTVILPVFGWPSAGVTVPGVVDVAAYKVSAYAAFTITGYNFPGIGTWNTPCAASKQCIQGYFTTFATIGDGWLFTRDPIPNFGAYVVQLKS